MTLVLHVLLLLAAVAGEELAPRPFTAAQIRAFHPPGTTFVHAVESRGEVRRTRSTVVSADQEWVEFEDQALDEAGSPVGEPSRWKASWVELRDHATFPAQDTTITDVRHTVPAGTFECWLYVVTSDNEERHFYFAKEKPGAPIAVFTWKNGEVVSRMWLLEFSPPAGEP